MLYAVIHNDCEFAHDSFDSKAEALQFIWAQAKPENWSVKEHEWPASPVSAEELGLGIGQQSPTHALVASLTLLVQAIGEQTHAINRLADSNRDLVQAMAEDSGMDGDDEPKGYLNVRTL